MLHLLPIMGFAFLATIAPPPATDGVVLAAPAVANGAGLQVVFDPVSGRIVDNPTDAQLERLNRNVAIERRRSSWELREFRLPGGGWGVYLDGWADHSLAVEIAADGKARLVCSQGDDHTPGTTRSEDDER